ncbi:hypothetical protein AMATHDRAFT_151584 [Amanita thiersii Skay4041]|uniref:Nucleoporin Nup37 n=1 Tax=Amanita thiersii Skay4041 TaxID=703135 RepID=A0A2A9NEC9_9AGAR|nr:hypothetical protein AMATHDRAFT_151584 [Amanita thiersii Skay4041]
MDLQFTHNTDIQILQACPFDEAVDLIAIGGDNGVDILVLKNTGFENVASFSLGSRVTALAWSSKTVSPTFSDDWMIELAVASSDCSLQLLTNSESQTDCLKFGGGLTGHHGKINAMTFCGGGGGGENSMRYLATVSDDKMLMVWDLYPKATSSGLGKSSATLQPTAYVIPFMYPLVSIDSQPASGKVLLVTDCRGCIFITDWKSDPGCHEQNYGRHSSIIELFDPRSLATAAQATSTASSAFWRPDTTDIIGAVHGSRFSIWDMKNLQGGRAFASGICFPDGAHQFRWCRTCPEYFATASRFPTQGAIVNVYNLNYIHAQPTTFNVASKPNTINAMDFISLPGIPRIVAATGRKLTVFFVGVNK